MAQNTTIHTKHLGAVSAEPETLDTGSQASIAAHCNCLSPGETLDGFEWFELMPCHDTSTTPGEVVSQSWWKFEVGVISGCF